MEKNEISFYMMDDSDSDNKESIIDYMLSWTLRMSSVSNDGYDNLVSDYCKKILSKIIFIFSITSLIFSSPILSTTLFFLEK